MTRAILCLLLSFSFVLMQAREASSRFTHIGVKEGLSNDFVRDLAIDGDGFVWVATEAGMIKLAGNVNKHYTKNNSALISNEFNCLYYDPSENQLWIASRSYGVNLFDCATQQFTTLTTDDGLATAVVTYITAVKEGGLWILHQRGDLQHYDTRNQLFTNYNADNVEGLNRKSRTCIEDSNGNLYVGHILGV